MSSETSGFTLSSLTLADPPGRSRLHSRSFAIYSRMFSLMLFFAAGQVLWGEAELAAQSGAWPLVKVLLVCFGILAVSRYLWIRPRPIFATKSGLLVGAGKKRRLIPWARVLDVREMPSVRMHPFSNPRMWQVDLDHDQRFDFCGVREAREIVIEYVKRAETRAAHGDTSQL
jgi:hypothetical protein